MIRKLTMCLVFVAAPALAQSPDGGACNVDSDCLGCGWVCSWQGANATNHICVPADLMDGPNGTQDPGWCDSTPNCVCGGQACVGTTCTPEWDAGVPSSTGGSSSGSSGTAGSTGAGSSSTGGAAATGGVAGTTGGAAGSTGGAASTSSSGGTGGSCGVTGVASCTSTNETTACCSQYCGSTDVCHCNIGEGHTYPCITSTDCCTPATCQGGICVGGSSSSSGGGTGGSASGGTTGAGTGATTGATTGKADAGTGSGSSGCGCGSSGAGAEGLAMLVLGLGALVSRRRRA